VCSVRNWLSVLELYRYRENCSSVFSFNAQTFSLCLFRSVFRDVCAVFTRHGIHIDISFGYVNAVFQMWRSYRGE
jgi:hypothetical protein